VLTWRRCDGGRREDAIVLNPLGKVETVREDADSYIAKSLYIVYWNSYAVFNDYRQLRISLPLTKRQMMLAKDVGLGRCTC